MWEGEVHTSGFSRDRLRNSVLLHRARNQRHSWASFFDNVDAIIFLAPISAFNQVLSEDPRVNRVADSLHLFRAICANKLLSGVNIVLFLNKANATHYPVCPPPRLTSIFQ